MSLHGRDEQLSAMSATRSAFAELLTEIDHYLPDGPDKTHVMRQLRDCSMWANVAITRNPDGSPRG